MAELPAAHFPPESGNENYIEPHVFPSFHYTGVPPGVQNVGMYQPNNQNFMQTFAPPCQPPVHQSGFSGSNMSKGVGPNVPPCVPYPRWPPSWNTIEAANYQLGFQHGMVYPPETPSVAIPFDRSVPPPPLPPISVVPTQQHYVTSHRPEAGDSHASKVEVSRTFVENDRIWIDSWLSHRPQNVAVLPASIARTKKKVKIWEVKQLLQSCFSLLGELEMLERELKAHCEEMDEVEWKEKLGEVEVKKSMLNKSLGLLDEDVLSSLRSTLLKRKQKRVRMRGRQIINKELADERMKKRKRLHLEADMWLERKQAEVDMHKREEMLKQEADAVLWEVRRKQSEGRRILSLLTVLVKLHHVRVEKNKSSSNPVLSENEDQFQVIIDKLSNLWERQMSEYDAEERALRVMMNERPEGIARNVRDRHKATGDLQRSLRLWENLLFGTGSIGEELLSLGSDSWQSVYLHPSKSLDALLENRRQWDQFISTSPSASSIPAGWVIPAEASSEEWKALIGSHGELE